MTAAHTPGPWTAHPPHGGDPDADGDKHHWVIRAPGTRGAVSYQLFQLSSMNTPELEHDARLISAAPDLLEALIAITTVTCIGMDVTPINYAYDRARAAIAKATGGSV